MVTTHIQLLTREPKDRPSVEGGLVALRTTKDLGAQARPAVWASGFNTPLHTDGYRDHSAATRDQGLPEAHRQPDDVSV